MTIQHDMANDVVCHTSEESAARFDRLTRRHLHLSAEDFLRKYADGEYADADPDEIDGLVDILIAMPQR